MSAPIPVTLLTGFLGCGKTTLLQNLLANSKDTRFSVIENEFGAIDIDTQLVASTATSVFNLVDGCLCCTVRHDLITAFEQIERQKDAVDHVIIEASGLADPGPVIRVMERLRGRFDLRGVVAVIDAFQAEADSQSERIWSEQVVFADLIVVNKASDVSAVSLARLSNTLTQINPTAPQFPTDHARIDPATILALNPHQTTQTEHAAPKHDSSISSVVATVDGDVDGQRLDDWLGSIVRHSQMEMLRMKGILALPDNPMRFVFQAVRSQLTVRQDRDWGDTPRRTQIVFIGRHLQPDALHAGVQACALSPSLLVSPSEPLQ